MKNVIVTLVESTLMPLRLETAAADDAYIHKKNYWI